jgi:hypothetical protein
VNMQGMALQDNEDMYFLLALKPSGMLSYVYEIGDDIRFRFHTLAEVGEPYQPVFREDDQGKGLGRGLWRGPRLLSLDG